MKRNFCKSSLLLTIIFMLCFIASRRTTASEYTITDLGSLDGDSRASAINDRGQVVGESTPIPHVFFWTAKDGMKDIGTLGGWSKAYDINNRGEVVGSSLTNSSEAHAFFWTESKGVIDIGTLNGGNYSWGFGINDRSQVVGQSNIASGVYHAFFWTAEGGITDLHMIANLGGNWSGARDSNNRGQIVGWGETASGDYHAVIWTAHGAIKDIGTFNGFYAYGQGINEHGEVVGYMSGIEGRPTAGHALAFLWTKKDGMIDLGSLGGNSYSSKINDRGQVVGGSQVESGMYHPFIWDPINGMRDLNDLIPSDSGWLLETNWPPDIDINNLGQIAGVGKVDLNADGIFDAMHAFLLTPITEVTIDIKPHRINPKSKGKIKVAILSTKDFDAHDMVNIGSLTFGRTGDEQSLAFCNRKPKDVNHDCLKDDLVCHFYAEDAGLQCGDTKGILKGKTMEGIPIEGSDSVMIKPCK